MYGAWQFGDFQTHPRQRTEPALTAAPTGEQPAPTGPAAPTRQAEPTTMPAEPPTMPAEPPTGPAEPPTGSAEPTAAPTAAAGPAQGWTIGYHGEDDAILELTAAAGIAITGAAAEEVARSIAATVLVGCNNHPPARVVACAPDAQRLFGTLDTERLPAGIQIVPDIDQAITTMDEQIDHRFDQPERDDWPAVVFVLADPAVLDAEDRELLRDCYLADGQCVGISVLSVGPNALGDTIEVDAHGSVTATHGDAVAHLAGARLFAEHAKNAAAIFTTLTYITPEPDSHDHTAGQDTNTSTSDTEPVAATDTDTSIDGGQNHGDTRDADAASTAAPELPAQVDEAASAPVTAPPLPQRQPDDEPDDDTDGHAGTGEVPTVPIPTTRAGTLRLEILRGTATLTLLSDEQPTTSVPVPIPDGGVIAQLLTLLALEPAGMRKENLVEALWPDAKNPAASLNTTLWDLRRIIRKEIGQGHVGLVRNAYKTCHLDPGLVTVDYWEFRGLREPRDGATVHERVAAYRGVLAHYRGELGRDIDVEWIESYRQELRRDAVKTATNLADELIDQNDLGLAVTVLHQARTFDPCEEPLYQKIIRLERELDRPEDAINTYKLLEEKLAEIGTKPHPLTTRIAYGQQANPHRDEET
jgi:DNA-binding SARP family transcriptional activator